MCVSILTFADFIILKLKLIGGFPVFSSNFFYLFFVLFCFVKQHESTTSIDFVLEGP